MVLCQAAYYEKGIAFFIAHKAEQPTHTLAPDAVRAVAAAREDGGGSTS